MKGKRPRTPEEQQELDEWSRKISKGEMFWVIDVDSIGKLKNHLKKIDYQLRQIKALLKDLPLYM